MKKFNITGLCIPNKHYLVDTSDKLNEIISMIEEGLYFTINRGRQYGKTTTLNLLEQKLTSEYLPLFISFEGIGEEPFKSPDRFCQSFLRLIKDALRYLEVEEAYRNAWFDEDIVNFELLDLHIEKMCQDKKVVLMIDEVDKTSNFRTYIHFLGLLRDKYLARERGKGATFHSVILAGVYDIKNIKLKMVKDGSHIPQEGEKIFNSPWNIASDFLVDMSFHPTEIATMLTDYEKDYHTGMDIGSIAQAIYDFTSGYPYLVSDICKIIDERMERNWTAEGVQNAVKLLLKENNTLFDDLFKNLENNQELYDFIYDILILNERRSFRISNPIINLGSMYGIFKEVDGSVFISNWIFEICITEHFISKDEMKRDTSDKSVTGVLKDDVVKNGQFDMQLCLEKFAQHFGEIFTEKDAAFLERQGRLIFLSYLRPLINGAGFYHIETQLSDERKMDIVVDYNKMQFIIELKLWRGQPYKEEGLEQLAGYLGSKGAEKGYLLTFDFKKQSGQCGQTKWLEAFDKKIFDATV